ALFVDGNYWVSLLFFSLAMWVFLRGVRGHDWDPLSPQRLFLGLWFFLLALGNLRLSIVEQAFSMRVWLIILSALGSFYLGARVASGETAESQWLPLSELHERCKPHWDFERSAVFIFGLFAISALAMGYELY